MHIALGRIEKAKTPPTNLVFLKKCTSTDSPLSRSNGKNINTVNIVTVTTSAIPTTNAAPLTAIILPAITVIPSGPCACHSPCLEACNSSPVFHVAIWSYMFDDLAKERHAEDFDGNRVSGVSGGRGHDGLQVRRWISPP